MNHHLEDVPQTIRNSDRKSSQCRGITHKKQRCRIWIDSPDHYCGYHKHQDTTGPDTQRPSLDRTALTVSSERLQCSGITQKKQRCRIWVDSPDRYCGYHQHQDIGPSSQRRSQDIVANPAIELNERFCGTTTVTVSFGRLQCSGITQKKMQCRIWVNSPDRYCRYHKRQGIGQNPQHQSRGTAAIATELNGQCRSTTAVTVNCERLQCSGITQKKQQCRIWVNYPDRYCRHHKHQDIGQNPQRPSQDTAANPATELSERCRGITSRHVRCKLAVKPPAQYYCRYHVPASVGTVVQAVDDVGFKVQRGQGEVYVLFHGNACCQFLDHV